MKGCKSFSSLHKEIVFLFIVFFSMMKMYMTKKIKIIEINIIKKNDTNNVFEHHIKIITKLNLHTKVVCTHTQEKCVLVPTNPHILQFPKP
jgi:hypothetical protein